MERNCCAAGIVPASRQGSPTVITFKTAPIGPPWYWKWGPATTTMMRQTIPTSICNCGEPVLLPTETACHIQRKLSLRSFQLPLGLDHHAPRVLGRGHLADAHFLDEFQVILVIAPILLIPDLGVSVGAVPVGTAGVIHELLLENGCKVLVLR